jgi:type I restriction enzyme S subunit
MSEWKEYKLGQICDVRDGTHDSPKESHDGYPLVTSKNIKNGVIDISNTYLISESDYIFVNQRSKVEQWDVLFSMIGTIGECAIVKKLPNFAIKNVGLFKTNGDRPLAEWIYYYFHSQQAQNEISACVKGSTQQYISLTDLRNFPIEIPSRERQQHILSILTSLDDKVDLLNRENATLEAMAETLFRQWFIEEAKEDWEEGKLGDLIEVKYGKDHKKLNDGTFPVFGSGGIMRYAESAIYDKESVLIPRKGSLNNVMYIDEPFWTVDTMFYTEMRRPNIAKFIFHFMKGQDLANMNVGSAVPSMTTEVLNNIPLDIPPQELFDKFEKTVSVFYLKQKQNRIQIRNLLKQRDILLPKLMSNSNII